MNKPFLIQQLENIKNAKRENRLRVANLVIENKELFKYLLEIVFEFDNKLSIKAAWVLEFVCAEKLNWLAPHLNYFTENISNVKFDSAVRPMSKICEFLAKDYTSKNNSIIKSEINSIHIEKIIETGFDWLIGKQKVAVKAYTMEMLFLFGKKEKWVHKELQLIIQQNMINESAAYQARGKKILSWINKKKI
ncbi:MAG: adenylosuccinate lyase [Lutibacter sp.]|uniref:adenylosuccinate lyase n=1 Tax=Lutibacter sp. TaxID=1925666 RepID=UPI001A0EE16A|nr:adenylosuccinate lyase [Lutibacter sp.]NOR27345.1 adenylosuccinate lyase [Lutibacter sp.]